MIPHFANARREVSDLTAFTPPPSFHGVSTLYSARLISRVEAGNEDRADSSRGIPADSSLSQRAGLKFEEKMRGSLSALFPDFRPGLWFFYSESSHHKGRRCQIDGLVEFKTRILLFEIKSQHTVNAWFQLRRLYQPIVEHVFDKKCTVVEVVERGDAMMAYPERVRVVKSEFLEFEAKMKCDEFLLCYADSFKKEPSNGKLSD